MVIGHMLTLCDALALKSLANADSGNMAIKSICDALPPRALAVPPNEIHFTEYTTDSEPAILGHTQHSEQATSPTPTHEAFNISVRQHHIRRLRNSTKASIFACRDMAQGGGPLTPCVDDSHPGDRLRLVLSLHNVNNVAGMLDRLRELHEGSQEDSIEQYAAVDFIVMPEVKATLKSEPKAKHAICKMMGSTELEFAISKHGHDLARHGNGIAFIQAFLSGTRAWRVRTNLSCVVTHIKGISSLTRPGQTVWKGYKPTTNRLSLTKMGEQPGSFTGDDDDSWYDDTGSEDGRWIEIVGWLHGEEYPRRWTVGHYGMYESSSAENDSTHYPSTDNIRHDDNLVTYVEHVPSDVAFVLMGDFNRVADLTTGVWTKCKPPPSDVEGMAEWRRNMYNKRIPGTTRRGEVTFLRLIMAGLVDASTVLHKPLGTLSSGGFYSAIRAVLLSRIDFILLNASAAEDALYAENSCNLAAVQMSHPHEVHHLVNARCGATDHCVRTIVMEYLKRSRNDHVLNMLFATTVTPRYERVFRGYRLTNWYYNVGGLKTGADWTPACILPTHGEARARLRQRVLFFLYIWDTHQCLMNRILESVEQSVCVTISQRIALACKSTLHLLGGVALYPMPSLWTKHACVSQRYTMNVWVDFIRGEADRLCENELFMHAVHPLSWEYFPQSRQDHPGDSASKTLFDAVLSSTQPGDMYAAQSEFVAVATRAPNAADVLTSIGKQPAVTTNTSMYHHKSGDTAWAMDWYWVTGNHKPPITATERRRARLRMAMSTVKAQADVADAAAYDVCRHFHERDDPVLTSGHRARYSTLVLQRYLDGTDREWRSRPHLCDECIRACRRILLYASRRERLIRFLVRRQIYVRHGHSHIGVNDACLRLMADGLDTMCAFMPQALHLTTCQCSCTTSISSWAAHTSQVHMRWYAWRRLYLRLRCPFHQAWAAIGTQSSTTRPWRRFTDTTMDKQYVSNHAAGGTGLRHDHSTAYTTAVEIVCRAWFRAQASRERPGVGTQPDGQRINLRNTDAKDLKGLGAPKPHWLYNNVGTHERWANANYSPAIHADAVHCYRAELRSLVDAHTINTASTGNRIRLWRMGCGPASTLLGSRAPFSEHHFLQVCKAPVQWCTCTAGWTGGGLQATHIRQPWCSPVLNVPEAMRQVAIRTKRGSLCAAYRSACEAYAVDSSTVSSTNSGEAQWNGGRWVISNQTITPHEEHTALVVSTQHDDTDGLTLPDPAWVWRPHDEQWVCEDGVCTITQASDAAQRLVEAWRTHNSLAIVQEDISTSTIQPIYVHKTKHWAWYVWPTSHTGRNDPHKTAIRTDEDVRFILECPSAVHKWVSVLDAITQVLLVQQDAGSTAFFESLNGPDRHRIRRFCAEWGTPERQHMLGRHPQVAKAVQSFITAWRGLQQRSQNHLGPPLPDSTPGPQSGKSDAEVGAPSPATNGDGSAGDETPTSGETPTSSKTHDCPGAAGAREVATDCSVACPESNQYDPTEMAVRTAPTDSLSTHGSTARDSAHDTGRNNDTTHQLVAEVSRATRLAMDPASSAQEVVVQATSTTTTSSTREEYRADNTYVHTSVDTTTTSSVTVKASQAKDLPTLQWDDPKVVKYMREHTDKPHTIVWRGIVMGETAGPVQWAEREQMSEVLSSGISNRMGIPRTTQPNPDRDKPPEFEKQPVKVLVDNEPLIMPTGQQAYLFTATMPRAPQHLRDQGDTIHGDLSACRSSSCPMRDLGDALFGKDVDRVKQLNEELQALHKRPEDHSLLRERSTPFRVLALGSGHHDGQQTFTPLKSILQRATNAHGKRWRGTTATSETADVSSILDMWSTVFTTKVVGCRPVDETCDKWTSYNDAECCAVEDTPEWLADYEREKCENGDDTLSLDKYIEMRLGARHTKDDGSIRSPLRIKLSIGPPPGIDGPRFVVSAILDTGASLTLISLQVAQQLHRIYDAHFIRLPPNETPTCSGAYGGRNSAVGYAQFQATMHDRRSREAAAMINTSVPGMVTQKDGFTPTSGYESRWVEAWVFESLGSPCILGMDWILRNQCRINAAEGVVYLDAPSMFPPKALSNTVPFNIDDLDALGEQRVNTPQIPTFNNHTKIIPALSNQKHVLVCAAETTHVPPGETVEIASCIQWGTLKPDERILVHVGDMQYTDKLRIVGDHAERTQQPSLWRAFHAWGSGKHEARLWRPPGISDLSDRNNEGYIVKAPGGGGLRSGTREETCTVQLSHGRDFNSDNARLSIHNDSSEMLTIPAMYCIGHILEEHSEWHLQSLPQPTRDLSYHSNDRCKRAADLINVATMNTRDSVGEDGEASTRGVALSDVDLVKVSVCDHEADCTQAVNCVHCLDGTNMSLAGSEVSQCGRCRRMAEAKASHVAHSRYRLHGILQTLFKEQAAASGTDAKLEMARRVLAILVHGLQSRRYLWYPVMCWHDVRSEIQRLVQLIDPSTSSVQGWVHTPRYSTDREPQESPHSIATLLHREAFQSHAAFQRQRSEYKHGTSRVDVTPGFCPIPLLDTSPSGPDIATVMSGYEGDDTPLAGADLSWEHILSDSVNTSFDGTSVYVCEVEQHEENISHLLRCMPTRRHMIQREFARQQHFQESPDFRATRDYVEAAVMAGTHKARSQAFINETMSCVVTQVEARMFSKHLTSDGSVNHVQECAERTETSSAVRARIAGMINQMPSQPSAENSDVESASGKAPGKTLSSNAIQQSDPKAAPPLTPSSETVRCDSLRGPPHADCLDNVMSVITCIE